MTRYFVKCAALMALFLGLSLSLVANAADLDDPYGIPQNYQASNEDAFHGLGLGIHGGGSFASIDVADTFDGISADGAIFGVHADYLLKDGIGRFGPWIEASWSNVNTNLAGIDVLRENWNVCGGGKLGIALNGSTLLSGHAGYCVADWSTELAPVDLDVSMWKVGGCIETMAATHVSIGLCGDYAFLDKVEAGGVDMTPLAKGSEKSDIKTRITWRH